MSVVGVVGLGIMGTAMARNLVERGHEVRGTDVSPERVEGLVAAGGAARSGAAAVAEGAEVVLISLPHGEAAEQVCRELAESRHPGLVVVETSTLSLEVKQRCREIVERSGATLLDCPLSGTGAQAEVRDLVVLGSGDAAAFERARPVLADIARSVRHLGDFGTGTAMKLVANLLVSVHNASAAEAFALGVRAGLAPQVLYETVREGAGGSVIFDKRGPMMVAREYLPATARVSMFVKDVQLVQELAESVGLATPVLDATLPLYRRAVDAGFADADAAALLDVVDGVDGVPTATPTSPGTMDPAPTSPGTMSLAVAEALAAATLRHGEQRGAAPLTVAVLDAGGHLVSLKRADGSGILRPQVAVAKAYGAVGMGMSSRDLAVRAERQPVFFGTLAAAADGRFAPAPGGVLVRDAAGNLLGAVGVSGDVSDMDEQCAVDAVLESGLVPDPAAGRLTPG